MPLAVPFAHLVRAFGANSRKRDTYLSEPFQPRTYFNFPGPGAAFLADEVEIALGDRVRVQQAGIAGLRPPRAADAAVDHHMRDVDALRVQLARRGLRQAAQRELAHRERRAFRVALNPGAGA